MSSDRRGFVSTLECLAASPPGLERLVADESGTLGLKPDDPLPGGVPFAAGPAGIYRANLGLAVASRILVRLGRFRARGFAEMERKAVGLPWEAFWDPASDASPRFDVTSRKSRLYHTGAVAERLRNLLLAGREPAGQGPRFVVRIVRDEVEISVDASGEHLHRRGYREAVTRAPLRENLAAAMLAVGWDHHTPLVDPFCGSGTIVIEAARRALGIPPGSDRSFAFQRWPSYEPATWDLVQAEVNSGTRAPPAPLRGSDRDAGAIQAARENAARGRVGSAVAFDRCVVSDLRPCAETEGSVVTNPPYGHRVSGTAELRDLYARLGQVLKRRFSGWRVAVLAADRALPGHIDLALQPTLRFSNGGIPVELFVGRVE